MEDGLYNGNQIGVIIQARMSSTRMPGKIMQRLPFGDGEPILHHIVNTAKAVKKINFICIATSVNKENDVIEENFRGTDTVVFRGNEQNVLSRYGIIGETYNLNHIIRLTGDNPLVDQNVLSQLIDFHIENNYDHSSTSLLPLGTNISIFKAKALQEAYQNASQDFEKEHVEPWILNNPKFSKGVLEFDRYKKIKDIRLTIDYPSDYAFLNIIFNHFVGVDQKPSVEGIFKLLIKAPWLKEINNSNYQKKVYDNQEDEVNDAIHILENLELYAAAQLLRNNIGSI